MILLALVFLPDDRNFLFHPTTQANLTLYAYIVDPRTTKILVSNTSNRPLHISRHQKLGHIIDIYYENCFLADAQATFVSAAFLPKTQTFFDLHIEAALALTDIPIEI